jgi:hypothetical protein
MNSSPDYAQKAAADKWIGVPETKGLVRGQLSIAHVREVA